MVLVEWLGLRGALVTGHGGHGGAASGANGHQRDDRQREGHLRAHLTQANTIEQLVE